MTLSLAIDAFKAIQTLGPVGSLQWLESWQTLASASDCAANSEDQNADLRAEMAAGWWNAVDWCHAASRVLGGVCMARIGYAPPNPALDYPDEFVAVLLTQEES